MTKRLVFMVAALSAGGLLFSCSVEQPTAGCIVQDAEDWHARYYLKEDSQLNSQLSEACRAKLASFTGELLGVFKYTDPNNPADTKIAIRPLGVTLNASQDPRQSPPHNIVGTLPRQPDEKTNLCLATNLQTADVSVQGETGTSTIKYEFENVQVYSAPSAPGTQMGGDLTYTDVDGCTAEFSFRAIWPFVPCTPGSNDPAASCGAGSGLNPDFNVTCDPGAGNEIVSEFWGEDIEGVCVAADPIPSFKK